MNIKPTSVSRICPGCRAPFPYKDVHRCPGNPGSGVLPAGDPLIGAVLANRYEIESFLQEGGMGAVYKARHRVLGHQLAVKVLRTAPDEDSQQRFMLEAQAACSIGHVNIVHMVDFGLLPDHRPYLAMEFLQGQSLHDLIDREGRAGLAALRACRIGEQIALGMQAVHDKGIIHRDLKPGNIFLLDMDGKDFVKILDFGIAKLMSNQHQLAPTVQSAAKPTQDGIVMGTPEYMAPERAIGQPGDQREDQYALGCILYEMLTGTIPFDVPGNPMAIVMQHITVAPVPPRARRQDLPASLEQVVLRCLSKDPAGRFGSMRELAQALQREATGLIARDERSSSARLAAMEPTLPLLSAVRDIRVPATAPAATDQSSPKETPLVWVPGQSGDSVAGRWTRRWLPAVVAGLAGSGLLLLLLWPRSPHVRAPTDQQRPARTESAAPAAEARQPAEPVQAKQPIEQAQPPAHAKQRGEQAQPIEQAKQPGEQAQLPALRDQERSRAPSTVLQKPLMLRLESGNAVPVHVSCTGHRETAILPRGSFRVSLPPGKKGACMLSANGYAARTMSFDALRGGHPGGAVSFRLEPL